MIRTARNHQQRCIIGKQQQQQQQQLCQVSRGNVGLSCGIGCTAYRCISVLSSAVMKHNHMQITHCVVVARTLILI